MGRRALTLLGSVFLALVMPASVLAASVVDQKSEAGNKEQHAEANHLAQTFTVGITGKLTGVDLRLYDWDGGPVLVFINSLDRQTKLPTGKVYASSSQTVLYDQWYHFSFAPAVQCSKGARLAIVFYGGLNSQARWSAADVYSGGQALKAVAAWEPLGGDFDFRTYMEAPAPPPTPKPVVTPKPKPVATPTPTPTPTLSTDPTVSAATDTPAATGSPAASTVTAAPSASAGPGSDASSSDPNGPAIPLLVAGVVGAGLLMGGIGFAMGRRRPKSA